MWRAFESGKIRAQAIDLGVITSSAAPEDAHYFCCVAGIGLDSAVARRANEMPRWLRGRGGYVLALLPQLAKLPAFFLRLTQSNGTDRAESETSTLLAAFDGKLDICRISTLSPLKLFCMFPTVYFGRHLRLPEVQYSRAERVLVQTDTPQEIYADGEFVCETPAEISVAAKLLPVIYSPI
jgi:diacylglycerol kinase (ATP)